MPSVPNTHRISTRTARANDACAPIVDFVNSPFARRAEDPTVANFMFGNPHELPIPGLTASLRRNVEPQHKDWFAYQMYQRPAQHAVAEGLRARYGLPFDPDDVLLTTGAFAGLSVVLQTLVEEGDEVIFCSPPWFFYESMILATGAAAVRLPLPPPVFDLDPRAVAAAITPRTRAIIVNSAHNPTGRVYQADVLRALSQVLEAATARNGRPIYLLSDEAYSHLVFDERRFLTPTGFYPWSLLIYTYGKVLLAPGQRVGYVALAPEMPDRAVLRSAIFSAQMIHGWTFPNALMQHALPDLERESIDVAHLQRKRDRLVRELRTFGYEVQTPESTFYLIPESPESDDRAFCDKLAERDVLCLPGSLFELPGYFRISTTASDEMIDRALPAFEAAITARTRR